MIYRDIKLSNFKSIITKDSTAPPNSLFIVKNAYIDNLGVIRTFKSLGRLFSISKPHTIRQLSNNYYIIIGQINQYDIVYLLVDNSLRQITTLSGSIGKAWIATVRDIAYISNGNKLVALDCNSMTIIANNQLPPDYIMMPPCLYLSTIGSRLVGAIGAKLLYSEAFFCHATKEDYFMDFGQQIIGVSTTKNQILVMLPDKIYLGVLSTGDDFIFNFSEYSRIKPIEGALIAVGDSFILLCSDGIIMIRDGVPRCINQGLVDMNITGEASAHIFDSNYIFIGGNNLEIVLDNLKANQILNNE